MSPEVGNINLTETEKSKMSTPYKQTDVTALSKTIDGIVGVVSEQGWDGYERYWGDRQDFFQTLNLLWKLSPKKGAEMTEMITQFGLADSTTIRMLVPNATTYWISRN